MRGAQGQGDRSPASERVGLQLRFEFYNLFNRVNLGGINANLTSANFGKSTSQLNPRNIQVGARISFDNSSAR